MEDNRKHERKKELWENNKTKWQIFKINAMIKWRRFDTQTKGMGLLFLLMMGCILVITVIPMIVQYLVNQEQSITIKKLILSDCRPSGCREYV